MKSNLKKLLGNKTYVDELAVIISDKFNFPFLKDS